VAIAAVEPARHPLFPPPGGSAGRRLARLHSRCRPRGRIRPASHPASRSRRGAPPPGIQAAARSERTAARAPAIPRARRPYGPGRQRSDLLRANRGTTCACRARSCGAGYRCSSRPPTGRTPPRGRLASPARHLPAARRSPSCAGRTFPGSSMRTAGPWRRLSRTRARAAACWMPCASTARSSDLQFLVNALPAEVEEGLWDGVARGLITADGFNAVRSLLQARIRFARRQRPYRRPGSRAGGAAGGRAWRAAGRCCPPPARSTTWKR
jgi:hypothetical protein